MQKSDFELAPGFEWLQDEIEGDDLWWVVASGVTDLTRAFTSIGSLAGDPTYAVIYPSGNDAADTGETLRSAADVRAWYAAHPDVTCPFVFPEDEPCAA